MRDIRRIPRILKEIGKIWVHHPDLRFSQLLANITMMKSGQMSEFYYMEDEDLIEKLRELYDK